MIAGVEETMNHFICPVCRFDKLEEEPYSEDFSGSFEMCLCCRFEFGIDDFDCVELDFDTLTRKEVVEQSHIIWRKKWQQRHYEVVEPKLFLKDVLVNSGIILD